MNGFSHIKFVLLPEIEYLVLHFTINDYYEAFLFA